MISAISSLQQINTHKKNDQSFKAISSQQIQNANLKVKSNTNFKGDPNYPAIWSVLISLLTLTIMGATLSARRAHAHHRLDPHSLSRRQRAAIALETGVWISGRK